MTETKARMSINIARGVGLRIVGSLLMIPASVLAQTSDPFFGPSPEAPPPSDDGAAAPPPDEPPPAYQPEAPPPPEPPPEAPEPLPEAAPPPADYGQSPMPPPVDAGSGDAEPVASSLRKGAVIGLGAGYGRAQDSVSGMGGLAVDVNTAYFLAPWLGFVVRGSGVVNFEEKRPVRLALGFTGGVESYLGKFVRVGLGAGPYFLELYRESYWAPGAELGLGFVGGSQKTEAGVELRVQASLVEGQPVITGLGTFVFRYSLEGLSERNHSASHARYMDSF